jgi:hypothetical protein
MPIIAFCEDDRFREGLNPFYALVFHQLICPTSALRKNLSIPSRKNKSLRDLLKSVLRIPLSRLI